MDDQDSCNSIEDAEAEAKFVFTTSSTTALTPRDDSDTDIELEKIPYTRKRRSTIGFVDIPTVIVSKPQEPDELDDENEGSQDGGQRQSQRESQTSGGQSPGILRRCRSPGSDDVVNDRRAQRANVTSLYMAPPSGLKHFLKSIKRKRVLNVQKSLLDHPGENLHLFTDNFGVSALRQAVETGTPEIVDVLLDRCTSDEEKLEVIHHAILYAIHDDLLNMVKHLLEKRDEVRQSVRQGSHTSNTTVRCFEAQGVFEDAEFSAKLRPIVLAGQLERHKIIDLLIERNFTDGIHPLTLPCINKDKKSGCTICTDRKMFKGVRTMEQSEELLEIYRALSSPAYMWKTDLDDPVFEAFNLSGEMDRLKEEDMPFKDEYEEISLKCRIFARDILALCRNSEEVMTLLSRRNTNDKQSYKTKFPMIMEALRFNQREFIAYRSCQSVLQKEWFAGLPEWWAHSQYHDVFFILYLIGWTVCLPVLCVLYMLRLLKPINDHMQHPIGRFLSDTGSFFLFLMFIVIDAGMTAHTRNQPSKLPSPTQWMIALWVLGMTFRYVKVLVRTGGQIRSRGFSLWLRDGSQEWSYYVLLMLLAFLAYLFLRFIGTICDHAGGDTTKRNEMNMFHPLLLSECAYSVGCILAFTRLNALFKASNAMGPLQISLRRMAWDIVRFMLIFFIVITAFVIGITKLYSAYAGYVRMEYDDDDQPGVQPEELTTLKNTYKTLFWALFGYGDHSFADMLVHNVNDTTGEASSGHRVSELTGYTLLGAYHVVAIIVLLNMLIAMMANSYNVIESNADVEWRFARTRLRMSYFNEVGALPSPFNLIPVRAIRWLIKTIRLKCGKRDPPSPAQSRSTTRDATEPLTYAALMQTLIKRYWNKRKKQHTNCVYKDKYEKLLEKFEGRLSFGTDSSI